MTLEFHKVVPQIYKMGGMISKLDFDLESLMALAKERFYHAPSPEAVWERIQWVRGSDISGYRGAAPLGIAEAEPINLIVDPPATPTLATLVCADGSQVYPDEFAPVHYYLLNVGLYVYHHGQDITPEAYTFPQLFFHPDVVHDRYGRLISNRTVDDRRTVTELQRLAHETWQRRHTDKPLLALYDNRLMYLPSNDAHDSDQLLQDYRSALVQLRDANAILAGYVDNPQRSKRFIQLLYLLSLANYEDARSQQIMLARAGDLDGLRDHAFFEAVLAPGQRSAILVQNSPQNKQFHDWGENFEIAFFYLKVANQHARRVVRVDVPVWVARNRAAVDVLHGLLLDQCRLQGRNPYPYAITRADEQAVVTGKDSSKLTEFINAEVRRVKETLAERTISSTAAKARGKELARSDKRYHNMQGLEIIDDH